MCTPPSSSLFEIKVLPKTYNVVGVLLGARRNMCFKRISNFLHVCSSSRNFSFQVLLLPSLDPLLKVIIPCLYLSVAIEITDVAN